MQIICYLFILRYLLQLLQIILSHSFLFASEGSKRQNEQLLRHWSVFSGEIENILPDHSETGYDREYQHLLFLSLYME